MTSVVIYDTTFTVNRGELPYKWKKAKFVKDSGGNVCAEELLNFFDEEDTCRCIVNI